MIAETLLAIFIVAFLIVYATVELVQWRNQDRRRRQERLVHRNLVRMGGTWR